MLFDVCMQLAHTPDSLNLIELLHGTIQVAFSWVFFAMRHVLVHVMFR